MAQRILEPGQIETLAQRSIPRFRIAGGDSVFAKRASRLRSLAKASSIGPYLEFIAELVDWQRTALQRARPAVLDLEHVEFCALHGMPPLDPSGWVQEAAWRDDLQQLCTKVARPAEISRVVAEIIARLRAASPTWVETQARRLLATGDVLDAGEVDVAAAPFIMAALQVHAVSLASRFAAQHITPLDVAGVCPLCGTPPVASMVYATTPYQGYRYLHCALCATEWHVVRVQCTYCGANGKDIALQTLQRTDADGAVDRGESAIRAETCEHCHGYRKIFYEEWDPQVEPVADDLGSMALDMLVTEQGYHRSGSNPLLWLDGSG